MGKKPFCFLLSVLEYHEATVKRRHVFCVPQCACVGTVRPVGLSKEKYSPGSTPAILKIMKVSIGH